MSTVSDCSVALSTEGQLKGPGDPPSLERRVHLPGGAAATNSLPPWASRGERHEATSLSASRAPGPRACFLASSPVRWTPIRAWSLPCPGAPSTRLLLVPSLHPCHHLLSGQPSSSSRPPQPRSHRPPALRPPHKSRCSWEPSVQSLENCTETGVRALSLETGRPLCELTFHHHVMLER